MPISLIIRISLVLAAAALATPALGQSTIDLRATVRDFQAAHDDFATTASAGHAHYAGNVEMTLGLDMCPSATEDGFLVLDEWRDTNTLPIAPHLYGSGAGNGGVGIPGVIGDEVVFLGQATDTDSFDSRLGPYGGANLSSEAVVCTNSVGKNAIQVVSTAELFGDAACGVGGDPAYVIYDQGTIYGTQSAMSEPAVMPAITEPDLGPSIGDVTYDATGTHVLSTDLHVDNFLVTDYARLEIDGDVTILCEGTCYFQGSESVVLRPGATLRIYVKDWFFCTIPCNMENDADPNALHIYQLMNSEVRVQSTDGKLSGRIFAPTGKLLLSQSAEIFGSFIGREAEIRNKARFHVDLAPFTWGTGGPACLTVADTAGLEGIMSTGGITSASTFSEWFDNDPGVNLSMLHEIPLQTIDGVVWSYEDDSFYPVDHLLHGNEGEVHNSNFTVELRAWGTYTECADLWVEFHGGDGAWLFINGELVLDLGGTQSLTDQRIELDRLGLTDGDTIDFRLFYANRSSAGSVFRLRTNVALTSAWTDAASTGPFD